MGAVREELRAQLQLALPLAVGHLGFQLMGMVDTAMLGRYSDAALAGAGIGNGLLGVCLVLGMGVVMGMDSLVPQALGAGERERARLLLGTGVRVALIIGVPLTAVAAFLPLVLAPLGVASEIRVEVWEYTLGRLPGLIPLYLFTALRSYLQASSITRPIVFAVMAGNVLNVVADAVLIFGDRALVELGLPAVGLPALGTAGSALATSAVSFLSLAICAIAVRRMHADNAARRAVSDPSDRRAQMRSIVRLGLPIGLQLFAEVGIFALMGALAGRLGTTAAAAHNIGLTLASFVFHAIIGVGSATSVRVGLAVGAGDHVHARRAGLTGIGVGMALMTVSALTMVFVPEFLARLFTDEPDVIAVTIGLLQIAAVFQLSDGVQAIAAGALRGAGDTKSTMWANIAGHYAIGLPLALLLTFQLGLGASGLWWGISAGLTAVAIALLTRFVWISRRPIARSH